jgi:hypothetical protein
LNYLAHPVAGQRRPATPAVLQGLLQRSTFGPVQELLGHGTVAMTMIYTQVLWWGGLGVRSPGGHALILRLH